MMIPGSMIVVMVLTLIKFTVAFSVSRLNISLAQLLATYLLMWYLSSNLMILMPTMSVIPYFGSYTNLDNLAAKVPTRRSIVTSAQMAIKAVADLHFMDVAEASVDIHPGRNAIHTLLELGLQSNLQRDRGPLVAVGDQ